MQSRLHSSSKSTDHVGVAWHVVQHKVVTSVIKCVMHSVQEKCFTCINTREITCFTSNVVQIYYWNKWRHFGCTIFMTTLLLLIHCYSDYTITNNTLWLHCECNYDYTVSMTKSTLLRWKQQSKRRGLSRASQHIFYICSWLQCVITIATNTLNP